MQKALQMANEILDDPLKARFVSFWSGYSCEKDVVRTQNFCRVTGVIDYVKVPSIGVTPFWFTPGLGFKPHESARQWEITCPEVTPCLRTLCPGDIVTRQGPAKIFDASISYDNDVVICRWPQYHAALPWNAIHWFSGGFMGWSRALAWLGRKEPDCLLSQQAFVDADVSVMQCWEQDTGRPVHHGAIPFDGQWNPAPLIGICAKVADPSLSRLGVFQTNLLETLSPPCVSWSKGGKGQGLNNPNGFAFFEAIEHIAVTQPLLIAAECADETPKHPHFELLSMTMSLLGYKSVWQQIVPMHQLTHAFRSRWLAVWLRQDIPGKCIDANFVLRADKLVPWHAESNKLFVPQAVQCQLILDERLRQIYGDYEMLPPAKRIKYSSQAQVFQLRLAQLTSPLPTLCANYTQQHYLDEKHLKAKGIFASIQIIDDQVSFFDPLRFVALFGTVGKVTLPCNVGSAFHILGNAIAVPHALLACAVAFSAIRDFDWTPPKLVTECWFDRLQFANSVVRVTGDFLVVQPLLDFCLAPPIQLSGSRGDLDLFITSPNTVKHVEGQIDSNTLVSKFVEEVIGVPQYLQGLISVVAGNVQMAPDMQMRRLVAIQPTWRIILDSLVLAVVDISFSSCVLISPTAPFVCEEPNHVINPGIQVTHMSNSAFFDHEQLNQLLTTLDCQGSSRHMGDGYILFYPLGSVACVRFGKDGFWPRVQEILQPYIDAETAKVFLSPSATLLGEQIALCVAPKSFKPDQVIVVLEDISKGCLKSASVANVIDAKISIHDGHEPFFLEHINGNPIKSGESFHLEHADLLSIRPTAQIRDAILCGGHHEDQPSPVLPGNATFYQRCEYITNTHGWIATDELVYLVSSIQDCMQIPVPHFEVMKWSGQASDLESVMLGEPEFPTNMDTWLFVLVRSHWILCIVRSEQTSAYVSVQGCDEGSFLSLSAALSRVLDLAQSRVFVSLVHTSITPHMCGWTFVHQMATRSSFIPQQNLPQRGLIHPNFIDALEDALASSREDWHQAGAPTTLCNFANEARRLFLMHLAKNADPSEAATGFRRPRPPPEVDRPPATTPADQIWVRLQHLWQRPAWLPSDVCDDLLETLRAAMPHTLFCPPCRWNSHDESFEAFNNFRCDIGPYSHAFLLVLWDTHWIICEIHKTTTVWITIQAPDAYQQGVPPLIAAITAWLLLDRVTVHTTFLGHTTLPNACGWACMFQLFQRFQVDLPFPTVEHHLRLAQHEYAETINAIRAFALRQWHHDFVPPMMIAFAQSALVFSINKILDGRGVQQYDSGGAPDAKAPPTEPTAEASSTKTDPDPWANRDPWQPAKTKQQTRWEDLRLTSDHPFVNEKHQRIPQTHRLQITASHGGLVLTTKAHLQELSLMRCRQALGAILPAIDSSIKGSSISSLGPYEVVLHDPNADTSYKRLVSLVVFSGSISYQLHTPAHAFKTAAISEIVIEIDNRLTAKEDFDHLKAAPASNIKKLVCDQLPACASQATFYSFRQNVHPSGGKQDLQLQCIVKIPTSLRKQVLECSGRVGFLTRDFLEKGTQSADTSVIPRFWPVTVRDLRELTITLRAVQGHAGVVLTRRGLAARSWNDSIANARQSLIPDDNRLCQENLNIVPKITFEAAGWPAGTTPYDVVTAVHKATSKPPVPMRTFRLGGVNVWVLAFESAPDAKQRQFTVQINDKIHEILLTEAPTSVNGKGASKGKPKKRDNEAIQVQSASASFARSPET